MKQTKCHRPEWADDEASGHSCPLENPNESMDECPEDCEWLAQPEEEPPRYAVSFALDAFVPCPRCGEEITCPDQGFDTEAEAMTWALERCECRSARVWRESGSQTVNQDTPCTSSNLADGKCRAMGWMGTDCTQEKCSAWHPELYAPEMYTTALDLWSERRRAAQEWEEFAPVATVLAYAMHLPEPAPYWEPPKPKRIELGTCHHCGQSRVLPYPAATQERADEKATALCKCVAGTEARRRLNEREVIAELFDGMEMKTLELLYTVADLVRNDYIKPGTSIKVADNCAAKFKVKDGSVIITRSEKLEHQHSL